VRPDKDRMNVWLEFDGHYEKHECDIMLKDGTVLECCWPNAGLFVKMNYKTGVDSKRITADACEILKIKYKDYFKKQFKDI
jgi:hypothetical protein